MSDVLLTSLMPLDHTAIYKVPGGESAAQIEIGSV